MKYQIGEILEVIGTNQQVIVEDYEKFDDLNLYYTSNKSAYPEHKLKPAGFNFMKSLFEMSDEEKNKHVNETFGNFFNSFK